MSDKDKKPRTEGKHKGASRWGSWCLGRKKVRTLVKRKWGHTKELQRGKRIEVKMKTGGLKRPRARKKIKMMQKDRARRPRQNIPGSENRHSSLQKKKKAFGSLVGGKFNRGEGSHQRPGLIQGRDRLAKLGKRQEVFPETSSKVILSKKKGIEAKEEGKAGIGKREKRDDR